MPRSTPSLTGVARTFGDDELIVSKTDARGVITYANDVFLRISGYPEDEVIGAPHNLVRHPDSPRGLFKLLWDQIGAGKEVFAYINNMAKNGDHYWVLAHVSPSFDPRGKLIGYHSNRRSPCPRSSRRSRRSTTGCERPSAASPTPSRPAPPRSR